MNKKEIIEAVTEIYNYAVMDDYVVVMGLLLELKRRLENED